MGVEFKKTQIKGTFPVFWRGEFKVLPGDFKVTTDLPDGTIIKRGTPILVDFANMECKICKAVKVVAGGDTTNPRIEKGSLVAKSDQVGGQTVNAIDSSNPDYDVLTLAASVSEATEGKILAVGSDVPNAVVESDTTISTNMGFNTVSAGYEGLVLKDVAYPVADDWLDNGYCMKKNHSIKYIRQ